MAAKSAFLNSLYELYKHLTFFFLSYIVDPQSFGLTGYFSINTARSKLCKNPPNFYSRNNYFQRSFINFCHIQSENHRALFILLVWLHSVKTYWLQGENVKL